ncbi:class I SAM-dependent methyltransferase [Rubrivivax albus]|uniref:Class I SAM-dependent methyltransferase n=1 Tax=Rubrivivax albus TaxID=2499835 RepID=A0A3S2U3M1_9BURK|nr:class I SAM-dependent methyltransferase [Rubrivivax albus]RVT52253.1 class I SAM-dependent methyltransferase [Rubrivivax albus]
MTDTRTDELELLASLVPLDGQRLIELGCGAAGLARRLVERHAGASVLGLEVDERQHAKNLASDAPPGLSFQAGGAQAIPFPDARFDGALMLKSLHHVPMPLMDPALDEVRRVLVPGGWLYVSEPVYAGALNEVIRLFNDEGEVRAAAQQALDRAIAAGGWQQADERRFEVPVRFADFAEFECRMVDVTFAERRFDDALRAAVRARFEPHMGPDGAHFVRPMHVRLLRRVD